jgi:hypothetical protein
VRRVLAIALLVYACAMPAAAAPSVSSGVVQRYLGALHARDYATAFALLAPAERAYFRTVANFASGFTADDDTLTQFAIAGERNADGGRIVIAREHITLDDPAHDARATTVVTVPYLVVGVGLVDAGRPWRAFATTASASNDGVRVTVKRVAFYARVIRVVVTMQNDGTRFVTLLPYGRSVLRDDAGGIYRPLATRDWHITDEQLFLGLRLAPNSRYTGTMAFVAPPLDDRARSFTLTLGPSVRDGASLPVSIDVPGIAAQG